jgi:hypothetical protein
MKKANVFITVFFVVFSFILFPINVLAEEEGYEWTGWRIIENLYPHDSGYVIILAGDSISDKMQEGCENRFYIHMQDPNYNAFVSTFLTVYGIDDEINIHYHEAGIEQNDWSIRFNRYRTRRPQ